ncbi:hypothetical protein CCB80_14050 [Armatimonadetes bacterium Uphvl-Ar1]|nr:hypothetical protein CCB80_14050 [Armatimonadetes bacterium Uphvl-Ar1]
MIFNLLLAFVLTDRSGSIKIQEPSAFTPTARVTNRKGNRQGTVLVLMYHRTGPEEKYMVRSRKNFKADLERLYRLGYRPVTLAEYGSNRMKLPRGSSPVVLTFDDSDPSQFSLKSDGTTDPNSMVGIWRSFEKKHPDFPVKGTFFVLPNGPFGRQKDAAKKLNLLKKWGSEIGSHTMTHRSLNKITDSEVSVEFGKSFEYVRKLGFTPDSLALPYGVLPKNRDLLKSAHYGGKNYRYSNVVLAGSEPAPSPLSKSFNPLRIPRVKAYDGEMGINWWLDFNKKHPTKTYVQP